MINLDRFKQVNETLGQKNTALIAEQSFVASI